VPCAFSVLCLFHRSKCKELLCFSNFLCGSKSQWSRPESFRMHMHMHWPTYTYAYAYTYIHICTYIYPQFATNTYTYAYTYTNTRTHSLRRPCVSQPLLMSPFCLRAVCAQRPPAHHVVFRAEYDRICAGWSGAHRARFDQLCKMTAVCRARQGTDSREGFSKTDCALCACGRLLVFEQKGLT